MTRSAKRLIALMLLDVQKLMGALESGAASVAEWQKQFSAYLAQYHTAEYLVGQRNRALTDPGRRYLKQTVEAQIGFLKNFATEIQNEAEFQMGWNARAAMYAQGIKASFWKGSYPILPLPAMPADGTTQCKTNCGCEWEIVELDGVGNVDAYWRRGKSDSCQTCVQRERDWSPLQIRDGRLV